MTEHKEIWFHADSTNVEYFLSEIKASGGWEIAAEPRKTTRDGTPYLLFDAHREN